MPWHSPEWLPSNTHPQEQRCTSLKMWVIINIYLDIKVMLLLISAGTRVFDRFNYSVPKETVLLQQPLSMKFDVRDDFHSCSINTAV